LVRGRLKDCLAVLLVLDLVQALALMLVLLEVTLLLTV